MKVALDEIVGLEPESGAFKSASASSRAPTVTVTPQAGGATPSDELNVIGMTVEQASELVDKFLDDAALAHLPRVRIIHGHGTGALRRGLGEFLSSHPLVQRHAFESEDRGGKAVTVVELRG